MIRFLILSIITSQEGDEVSLLKKGLNFAVTPQNFPIDDLITTTELACKNIKEKHEPMG